MEDSLLLDELWELIRQIPRGKVCTYGALGAALSQPTTGFLIGRWMGHGNGPRDIPWWRVIAKSGQLPISKIDPVLGLEQAELLRREGVAVNKGLVDIAAAFWQPE